MNIREKIKALEKLESEVSDLEEELGKYITTKLKYLYKLQEEYRKSKPTFKPIIAWEDIVVASGDIQISGNNLELYYYNTYTYNKGDIEIPIDALEDDSKIERWFKSKTSEFEERLEKAKKELEDKQYKEYLKLKEKYEGI